MYKYLTLLLVLPFLLLFAPTSIGVAEAAACAYDAALTDETVVIGGTTVSMEIDPATKPATGNAMYNNATVTVCIEEDDAGNVDIDWVDLDGNVLQTDTNVDTDNDIILSIANIDSYVGPIQFTIRPDAGGTGTSDFFFFLAPPPPTNGTDCTAGPEDRCLKFDPLPSYALSGQIYNQYFNSRVQELVTADLAAGNPISIPKDSYFPNLAYEEWGKDEDTDLLGLFADDVTYATDEHTTGQWVILYWWLTAGIEGFPAWTVSFRNNSTDITGDPIDLQVLQALQDRDFTPGTDYYGYIVLVLDRVVTDFSSGGWFDQIDFSIVGTAPTFIGVWPPTHSGTYSNGSKSIPSTLNGGYLQVVAEPTDLMLTIDVEASPPDVISATGLLWSTDNIISGRVIFHPGTNAGRVDYLAQLRDQRGQLLQSLYVANCDGITIVDVSFGFLLPEILDQGKILIREEADPRYPAKVVSITHAELMADLRTTSLDIGLSRYLAAPEVATSDVRLAFIGFGDAWGIPQGAGSVVVGLIGMGVFLLVAIKVTGSVAAGMLVALLVLSFFVLIGVLPATWLLLPLFAIIVGISWKMFGATA